jgi:hypothetical protein
MGFAPDLMSVRKKPFTATRMWREEWTVPGGRGTEERVLSLSAELVIARDSKGRIHTEMAFQDGAKHAPVKLDVYIYDPLAHTVYRYFTTPDHALPAKSQAHLTHLQLMSELSRPIEESKDEEMNEPSQYVPERPEDKVQQPKPSEKQPVFSAEREKAPPPDLEDLKRNSETGRQMKEPDPAPAFPLTDDLGEKEIQGIRAWGFRQVMTYGKSKQEFLIQDQWFSPVYAINVAYNVLRSNPHVTTSYELITLVDGEPDPSLFQLPPGYVVVEQPRLQMKDLPAK